MGFQESKFFTEPTRETKIPKALKCLFCATIIPKHSTYSEYHTHMMNCQKAKLENQKNISNQQQQNDSTSVGTANEFELIFTGDNENQEEIFLYEPGTIASEDNEEFNISKKLPFEHKQVELWNKVREMKTSLGFGGDFDEVKLVKVPKGHSLENRINLFKYVNVFDSCKFLTWSNSKLGGGYIDGTLEDCNRIFYKGIIEELAKSTYYQNVFKYNKQLISLDCLYKINSNSKKEDPQKYIKLMTLIGKVIAKCLLDGITMEQYLDKVILKHIVEEKLDYDDLYYIAYDDYQKIKGVRDSLSDSDHEAFFTYTSSQGVSIDLIPNGNKIPLTKKNIGDYTTKLINLINECYSPYTFSLKQALYEFIPKEVITQFTVREFELVLNGNSGNYVSLDEWRKFTSFKEPLNNNHYSIKLLWKYLEGKNQKFLHKALCSIMNIDEIPIGNVVEIFSLKKLVISSNSFGGKGKKVTKLSLHRNDKNTIIVLTMPMYENEDELRKAFDSFIIV